MEKALFITVWVILFCAAEGGSQKACQTVCSRTTCGELGLEDAAKYGSESVCGTSKINDACTKEVTQEGAKEFCQVGGMRMCTKDELENDEVKGTGCGLDDHLVWSSTTCEVTKFYASSGKSGELATECLRKDQELGGRCCADMDITKPFPCCDATSEREITVDWGFSAYLPQKIDIGQSLKFVWEDEHNIYQFETEAAFQDCYFTGDFTMELADTEQSMYVWTPEEAGTFYFGCQVPGHCQTSDGRMRLAVIVTGAPTEITVDWGFYTYLPQEMDIGQSLKFVWKDEHNVYQFENEAAFQDCDFNGDFTMELADTDQSMFIWTPEEAGMFYFGCQIPGHCQTSDGRMRIAVIVTGTPTEITIDWGFSAYLPQQMDIDQSLKFVWKDEHNVYQFETEAAFLDCDFTGDFTMELADTDQSMFVWSPTEAGIYYFGCQIPGHCQTSDGRMRIAVIVAGTPAEAVKKAVDWNFGVVQPLVQLSVGDVLMFEWDGAGHNVWQFGSATEYNSCDFETNNAMELASAEENVNGYSWTATNTGSYYFGCEITDHCQFGNMKIKAQVFTAAGAECPAEVPTNGATCEVNSEDSCEYNKQVCCNNGFSEDVYQTFAICEEGSWILRGSDFCIDYSECPADVPAIGAPCDSSSEQVCKYEKRICCNEGSPEEVYKTSASCPDGEWSVHQTELCKNCPDIPTTPTSGCSIEDFDGTRTTFGILDIGGPCTGDEVPPLCTYNSESESGTIYGVYSDGDVIRGSWNSGTSLEGGAFLWNLKNDCDGFEGCRTKIIGGEAADVISSCDDLSDGSTWSCTDNCCTRWHTEASDSIRGYTPEWCEDNCYYEQDRANGCWDPSHVCIPGDHQICFCEPATITGVVYADIDGNGVRDPNDTPIGDGILCALFVDGGSTVVSMKLTDANGLYSFTNVRGGMVYEITCGYDRDEGKLYRPVYFYLDEIGSHKVVVVPKPGETVSGNDFGFRRAVSDFDDDLAFSWTEADLSEANTNILSYTGSKFPGSGTFRWDPNYGKPCPEASKSSRNFDLCYFGDLFYLSGGLTGSRIGISEMFCEFITDQIVDCRQMFETYYGVFVADISFQLSCTSGVNEQFDEPIKGANSQWTVVFDRIIPDLGTRLFDEMTGGKITFGVGMVTDGSLAIKHEVYYGVLFKFSDSGDDCYGHCGYKSKYGCYCDNICEYHGDCCADVCETCTLSCSEGAKEYPHVSGCTNEDVCTAVGASCSLSEVKHFHYGEECSTADGCGLSCNALSYNDAKFKCSFTGLLCIDEDYFCGCPINDGCTAINGFCVPGVNSTVVPVKTTCDPVSTCDFECGGSAEYGGEHLQCSENGWSCISDECYCGCPVDKLCAEVDDDGQCTSANGSGVIPVNGSCSANITECGLNCTSSALSFGGAPECELDGTWRCGEGICECGCPLIDVCTAINGFCVPGVNSTVVPLNNTCDSGSTCDFKCGNSSEYSGELLQCSENGWSCPNDECYCGCPVDNLCGEVGDHGQCTSANGSGVIPVNGSCSTNVTECGLNCTSPGLSFGGALECELGGTWKCGEGICECGCTVDTLCASVEDDGQCMSANGSGVIPVNGSCSANVTECGLNCTSPGLSFGGALECEIDGTWKCGDSICECGCPINGGCTAINGYCVPGDNSTVVPVNNTCDLGSTCDFKCGDSAVYSGGQFQCSENGWYCLTEECYCGCPVDNLCAEVDDGGQCRSANGSDITPVNGSCSANVTECGLNCTSPDLSFGGILECELDGTWKCGAGVCECGCPLSDWCTTINGSCVPGDSSAVLPVNNTCVPGSTCEVCAGVAEYSGQLQCSENGWHCVGECYCGCPVDTLCAAVDDVGQCMSANGSGIIPVNGSCSANVMDCGLKCTSGYSFSGTLECSLNGTWKCGEGICGCVCDDPCGDKECGKDGCGVECGEGCTANNTHCVNERCVCLENSCIDCGNDIACQNSCVGCLRFGRSHFCNLASHMCECTPTCSQRICGPGDCGVKDCGDCDEGYSCTNIGKCFCNTFCAADQCGSKLCGIDCKTCDEGYLCIEGVDGGCVCADSCDNKECGQNNCGEYCGTGVAGQCPILECAGVSDPVLRQCASDGHCFCASDSCGSKECGENNCCEYCGTGVAGQCPILECAGVSDPVLRQCASDGNCFCASGSCVNKECGETNCCDNCGTCSLTERCTSDGTCE